MFFHYMVTNSTRKSDGVTRACISTPRYLWMAGTSWISDLVFDFRVGKSAESWWGNYPFFLLKCFHRGISGAKVKSGSKSSHFRPFSKFVLAFFCFKSGRGARYPILKSCYESAIAYRPHNYSMSFDSSRPKMPTNSIFRNVLFFKIFSGFWHLRWVFLKQNFVLWVEQLILRRMTYRTRKNNCRDYPNVASQRQGG